ncbi:MAG: acyl-CoA dehydratase activase-related protein [Adlercreutzia sp.]
MCYPAKLSHGHIMNLLDKHPDFIWMPCSKWERQEDETAGNHFNCPIVASYPEALRLNIDELRETDVAFVSPWVPYHDKDKLAERLVVELTENFAKETNGCGPALTADEIRAAVEAAWAEDEAFKRDIRTKGVETLAWMEKTARGIVLAGRPYHQDPEINTPSPSCSRASFGRATEDSVAHLGQRAHPCGPVDVPHAPVRGGQGGHPKARSRSHPAELLRVRPGCPYHRPGAGGARGGRQGVHGAEDRRGVELGRGAHPRAQPACSFEGPGRPRGRGGSRRRREEGLPGCASTWTTWTNWCPPASPRRPTAW